MEYRKKLREKWAGESSVRKIERYVAFVVSADAYIDIVLPQTTTRTLCYQEDCRSQANDVGRPESQGGESTASYQGGGVEAQSREEE